MIPPLDGLARSKKDSINHGRGAQKSMKQKPLHEPLLHVNQTDKLVKYAATTLPA